ncbi:MAG: class I SAM-dependent methyltransferase [Synechococcaceae cyanobacterium SM2_3_2]|nr:class I SAM-dependent methyltransferase [Synechococcaceae cyanobacterium SM2_3_2]
MSWCLYEPSLGYYESPQNPIGRRGDFVTSPQVSADFAELLGEQFVEMWQVLGQPAAFTLVEMGSGAGFLAHDLLTYLRQSYPSFWGSLTYISVERSAQMRQRQQQLMPPDLTDGVVKWVSGLEEISAAITGCLFSNELIDAMPVHRVQINQGSLQEIYVALDQQSDQAGDPDQMPRAARSPFVEQFGDLSTPVLAEYFQTLGIPFPTDHYPDGYRTEVNLAALDWLRAVAQSLERGYLLTIDYGHPAHRYYHPNRSTGTLLCYRQHISLDSPYEQIGSQDITAHADFTALQTFGQIHQLETLGLTQQSFFLANLGLLDRLVNLPELQGHQDPSRILQRRQSLHTLMDPLGLGQFGVLVQAKGLSQSERGIPLRGLR